jgi:DNA repair protein RadC
LPHQRTKYYIEKLKDKKKEYFIAVFLDSKNKIIKDEVISIGTLNASLVHPREVFKEAIKNSANAIILVHNHPSGDCEPSEEDKWMSEKLCEAGHLQTGDERAGGGVFCSQKLIYIMQNNSSLFD